MKNKTKKERMKILARNRHKHELRKKRKQTTDGWRYRRGVADYWRPNILAMFKGKRNVKTT